MRFVLDASVALSWCFPDETSEYADKVLEHLAVSHESAGAIVPVMWALEITNALLVGGRRGRLKEAHSMQVLGYLQALNIIVDDAGRERVFGVTLSLAREHNLSSYDAAYLELAMRLTLPLATQDKKLLAAAQSSGVVLLQDPDFNRP